VIKDRPVMLSGKDEKVMCMCVGADMTRFRLKQPVGYSDHKQEACYVSECVWVCVCRQTKEAGHIEKSDVR